MRRISKMFNCIGEVEKIHACGIIVRGRLHFMLYNFILIYLVHYASK